jgi:predicted nucleic acid-binding protein
VIILDTNVVSELMREAPAAVVHDWSDHQPPTSLYVTSITQAEVLQGIEFLPKGKRRDALAAKSDVLFDEIFRGHILPFGSDAARAYATIMGDRRRLGRPIVPLDAQIAAIARAHGASVATRNVDDFEDCGVELIDPWHG